MGYDGWPVYGKDLGSTIEMAEKVIAKIKSNKFDKEDLMALAQCSFLIVKFVVEKDDEQD